MITFIPSKQFIQKVNHHRAEHLIWCDNPLNLEMYNTPKEPQRTFKDLPIIRVWAKWFHL